MVNLFDVGLVFEQIPELLRYLYVNLEIAAIALVVGWLLGLLIAVIRMSKIPVLYQLATLFVSAIRGTPIIVQLYVTYFGIPILLRYINYYQGTSFDFNGIPPVVYAVVALGLNQAAFDSETIRSAIQSVDNGQIEAAQSLGMSDGQILRRVLLSQAVTVAIPPLGNSLIGLIKGTSLVFVCSVIDMTAAGKIIAGRDFRYFEVYVSIGLIFWALTIIIELVFKHLEKRFSVPTEPPVVKAENLLKGR